MLHCPYEISSSCNVFDLFLTQTIKSFSMKNLYPSYLIDKEIKTFLESKFTTKGNTNIVHNNKILFIITKAFLSTDYYTLGLIKTAPRIKFLSYAKTPKLKLFFQHSNCRTIFFKILFVSYSEVFCRVQIYFCWVSILLH